MTAILGPIMWYRGDSYPLSILIKDKNLNEAIDLTDYSFKLTVDAKENPENDSTTIFSVDGIIADQETDKGKVSFKPTSVQTNKSPGMYYYDVQMTDNSGNIRTIIKQTWTISQDISK